MSQHPDIDTQAPLTNFSQCHAGIVRHLDSFDELPALLVPAQRAQKIAADFLGFFREAAFDHHQDEERELFPAVLRSSEPGPERAHVQQMVDALTHEHREIEALWNRLAPQLKRLAHGQPADVDGAACSLLVQRYRTHARVEEQEFLPLAERILQRDGNHMAALGLSLHMRHQAPPLAHV